MEDTDLLRRIKAGDKAAFSELVALYSVRVLNTCYRFIPNQKDAEDISQEVFIEVFQSIQSFRGESKLSTWIYRIAVTKSLDEIRKRQRKKRIIAVGKMLHLDEISDWISGGIRADSGLHESESIREVMQVLNKLPENQRVAFTLSKIEGFSNQEIAEIMDTTLVAVESLVAHAKKKVSQELIRILNK